jgi:site-specific DNA-cytosine methylase
MKPIVLFSAFSGYGGSILSAKYAGLNVVKHYSSEIEESAIKVLQAHSPNTIQVGDIRNLNPADYLDLTHIDGGSPCQCLSFAGLKKGFATKSEIEILTLNHYKQLVSEGFEFEGQSYLFWEFVMFYEGVRDLQIANGIEPLTFLLENVNMTQKWQDVISTALGVRPIMFDAARVWAQSRIRLFWTDIEGVTVPEDKGIKMGDLIPDAVGGVGFRGRKKKGELKYSYPMTQRNDGKSNCLVTSIGSTSKDGSSYGTGFYLTNSGEVKKLTIGQIEILQGLEEGYTNIQGVSNTKRIKMIGNGWCIPVTGHIMSFLKKNKKVLESNKI